MRIPFNKPYLTGRELSYIAEAHANGHLSGDGLFTANCNGWLEQQTGARKALLTHSCSGALEMAAILADIQPGDEVIMPSFTFVSTANAFVLRGATPVFVDIREDTLNMDETKFEAAISEKTKAIVPVHYAGVGCDMDAVMSIADNHGLLVIEDAAQGVLSSYNRQALGTIGHLGAISFHETKNIISGEGGALLVNRSEFINRAEVIREKGTNRNAYFRGEVDKYTWVDIGSSYLPSELAAAFLWAQMEQAEEITNRRLAMWDSYHQGLEKLELEGLVRRPVVPQNCVHNAHMYYLLLPTAKARTKFIHSLDNDDIHSVFHYVPLHNSPMGKRHGRQAGTLGVTCSISQRLVRLPLWIGLETHMDYVLDKVEAAIKQN
jgi:dTDP-4-amino-4,6-dideoxygalactose transaminase